MKPTNVKPFYPAYTKYLSQCKARKEDSAAFRSPLGWAYRRQAFNDDIKSLLGKYITYGKISGHSFRSGMASLMAQVEFLKYNTEKYFKNSTGQ